MDYNSISINLYIKSHLKLKKENISNRIGPQALLFVKSFCLVYLNMFARLNEITPMTLQDIKETNVTDAWKGQKDAQAT